MNIGRKIKDFRLIKGITQETLAQELGVTPQAVSRWENGAAMPGKGIKPEAVFRRKRRLQSRKETHRLVCLFSVNGL